MRQLDRELSEYLESMVEGLGRSERRQALELYLTGLLLDGERKSVEPMAARLVEEEAQVEAMRQRLRQCVARADWSDSEVRRRLARKLEGELPGVEAFVIDDTGLPKKGGWRGGRQKVRRDAHHHRQGEGPGAIATGRRVLESAAGGYGGS